MFEAVRCYGLSGYGLSATFYHSVTVCYSATVYRRLSLCKDVVHYVTKPPHAISDPVALCYMSKLAWLLATGLLTTGLLATGLLATGSLTPSYKVRCRVRS
jgi:hypothetical protein